MSKSTTLHTFERHILRNVFKLNQELRQLTAVTSSPIASHFMKLQTRANLNGGASASKHPMIEKEKKNDLPA